MNYQKETEINEISGNMTIEEQNDNILQHYLEEEKQNEYEEQKAFSTPIERI